MGILYKYSGAMNDFEHRTEALTKWIVKSGKDAKEVIYRTEHPILTRYSAAQDMEEGWEDREPWYCDYGSWSMFYYYDPYGDSAMKTNDTVTEYDPKINWPYTGKWLDDGKHNNLSFYCSHCGHRAGYAKHHTYKFCPWCGCDMRGTWEDDDESEYNRD